MTLNTVVRVFLPSCVSIDPGQQPNSVVVSGFTVNVSVTFNAFSDTYQMLPEFPIKNDDVALESVESYIISLVSSNPTVNFGFPSIIQIIDDEGNEFSNYVSLVTR